MIELSQEMYHQEMAQAVYKHLRDFLLTKEKNHCQRVEYLPREVMVMTCKKLLEDQELRAHEVEAFVLTDQVNEPYEIESGALIEKRNRESFGVLVAFIPQGLRLPAEDSYDIHTFKTYDLTGVLRAHCRTILNILVEPLRSIARTITDQSAVKRQSVDRQLKYLLALRKDGAGWEDAGAYLHLVDLIPDLKLDEQGVEMRIDRNYYCVEELSNPDRTILQSIEKLVSKYGLKPEENNLAQNLIRFFRERNAMESGAWLKEILIDSTWRSQLSFDKWSFKDIAKDKIEIHLQPLEDPKTGALAKGLTKEGSNLVASTSPANPVHIKWETNPRNPDELGHYLITVVRDTDDENAEEEVLRRVVKKGRSTLKLGLKDIEMEEGEQWAVKIIIYAKDGAGLTLDKDESESFYIESGVSIEPVIKKIKKIRNRAEAFLYAAHKHRKTIEIDSENWEEGSPKLYRLKLKNRDIYRIIVNSVLYDIERRNIVDPMNGGAWRIDARNMPLLKAADLQPVPISGNAIHSLTRFFELRKNLFQSIQEYDAFAVVETLDLRIFSGLIQDYAAAYRDTLDDVYQRLQESASDGDINNVLSLFQVINHLDTVQIRLGSPDDEGEAVLMCPTHPLRLLWILQYQNLLYYWADCLNGLTEEEANRLLNPEKIIKITSLNIPSALSMGHGEIFINSDNLDLYWSIFPKSTTKDIRKLNSYVFKLLNIKDNNGHITTITPEQIADKLWRYLKHHPYVTTLKLNVINPGDGLVVLNAIRLLQADDDFKKMNYDVAFYGDMRYEMMGNAFDRMTEENLSAEGLEKDVDEELLRPNPNPLFPKLLFSKKKIKECDWPSSSINESHLSMVIDRFATKVLTRPIGQGVGSFSLYNLLAEYRTTFDLKGDMATWSRKIIANQNSEIRDTENLAGLIFAISDRMLRLSSCFFNWGKTLNEVPAVQLELSAVDKYIINHVHENSDWVLTIDRNFGIEYFDNPRKSSGNSYLIDYTPEFLDSVGHRLIISTYWLSEIEGLIKDGLKKMGIPGTGFHAVHILDILKSISGKLALKLINNPKDAREIIGLALTRLLLEEQGDLAHSVLIPIDSHISLFTEHKRQVHDETLKLQRSDLLMVGFDQTSMKLHLIEVKFRSGAGAGEEYGLKEQIVLKNQDTGEVIEALFQPKIDNDRFDRDIQNHQLARLLEFYLERCIRHGLIQENSPQEQMILNGISKVIQNDFQMDFEKSGYIFNLQGVSKAPENYKGNTIHVIGKDKISQLFDVDEEAIEPEPEEGGVVGLPEQQDIKPEGTDERRDDVSSPSSFPETEETETIRVTVKEGDEENEKTETTNADKGKAGKTPALTEKKTDLNVYLGKNSDSGKAVHWNPLSQAPKKLTNQHILIVGTTGAGKTQTASAFIESLCERKVPAIIFDFQGEYMDAELKDSCSQTFLQRTKARVVDASDGIPINPFEVPMDRLTSKKQNYQKVVYQVAASLKRIFGLGDIQHAELRDAINQAYAVKGFTSGKKDTWENAPPSIGDVWSILKEKEKIGSATVRNLNLRIEPLFATGIFQDEGSDLTFNDILSHATIVRLSNLATPELMVAVSRFMLQKIYSDMLAKGPTNQIRVFAVIDEAHKLSYDETLTELVREARKYGVGLLLASQSPKDFDRVAFDLMGTKIALHLEGEDARIMADNLGVIDKNDRDIARKMILKQPNLQALLRNNHYEPYIQVDIVPFFKKA
ncbi:MAG: ATP-binding protein [Syntrophales bacterium]